jgi:ribokinase
VSQRPKVTVLGSLNMDISVTVPRLPAPGQTVLGSAARFTPGGKGANQAVAAARLGAEVRMVGRVGGDDFGRRLLTALRTEGVDTSQVRKTHHTPTGLAMIAVDETGENHITVAPGANHEVGQDDVAAALATDCDVLVICAEIPLPAIKAALARPTNTLKLLNLAPVPNEALTTHPDWLVVNESEAAALLSHPVTGLAQAAQAAADLTATSQGNTVVTAGQHGAALATPAERHAIGSFPVIAVDTVGAGDAFVGALAVALGAGTPPAQAVRAAAAAGAAAATRPGAQAGMPRPADILAATGFTWPLAGNISRHSGGWRAKEGLA